MYWSLAKLLWAAEMVAIANAAPMQASETACTSLSTTTTSTTITATSTSSSTPQATPPPRVINSCIPGTKGWKHYNPALYNIGQTTDDRSYFHLANDPATKSYREQVLVFFEIPADATNFSLGWGISNTVPEFSTKGGATAALFLLDAAKLDLSAATLGKAAVDSAVNTQIPEFPNGRIGGAGFGFWDTPEYPRPQDHHITSKPLQVKERLAIRIGLIDEGEVKIKQTEKDGLYLQYDC